MAGTGLSYSPVTNGGSPQNNDIDEGEVDILKLIQEKPATPILR
jgi:hypothetical protein